MLAYLTNLDAGFGALLFPEFESKEFVYPRKNDETPFYFKISALEPNNSIESLSIVRESLSMIFTEIIKRIEIKATLY
jgi:hypothetical protein